MVLATALPAFAAVGITPVLETPPVDGSGDVADDPAIWVNATDASKSLVIVTNKSVSGTGGLHVYDLTGQQVSKAAEGSQMNGVDVRDGFALGTETVSLVGATNQSENSVDFFRVDETTATLTEVGSVASSTPGIYGFCMYSSAVTGHLHAIATHDNGVVEQFQLDGSSGAVTAELVRSLDVGGVTEGCAADDELAQLYLGEETVGVWKYSAEPEGGETRTAVDGTGAGGNLVADVEGIEIWYGPSGTGWLLVSSQGESTIAVYARDSANAYQGEFDLLGSGAIDDTTGTDGIDVTSAPLPAPFEGGLFVAHDQSRDGTPATNVKYVAWSEIGAALGL